MSKIFHVGILGAMPEEIGETINHIKNIKKIKYGDLEIFSGEWFSEDNLDHKIYISIAWSGWGKVSSARAATRILSTIYEQKSVDLIIFTGVAGAIDKKLSQWDIVIANNLIQHDMDARPIYPKYVVPSINKILIETLHPLINWSKKVLSNEIRLKKLKNFGRVVVGKIATGDSFISDQNTLNNLSRDLPNLCAVEMEGAAVAQVAYQEGIPFLIVRVISDEADNEASQKFGEFIKKYENESWKIIKVLLKNLNILEINHY